MSTKLSDSEQYLWNYIERNIIEIPNYSIAELSVEAAVSTATIVRTLKKKGILAMPTSSTNSKSEESCMKIFRSLIKRMKVFVSSLPKMNKKSCAPSQ